MSVSESENPAVAVPPHDPGPGWTLVWSDEFDRDVLDDECWNRQVEPAGRFNDEWQRYTDRTVNAFIENGQLVLRALHESDNHGPDQYTSARLNTAGKRAWRYGRVAARIRLPEGPGLWPAFWMLGRDIDENGGDTPWPRCGEIDILELYGSRHDGTVEANLHYEGADGRHRCMGAKAYRLTEGSFSEGFHVFELLWDETSMTWMVDGQAYAHASLAEPERAAFRKPFFLLLNVAVGGRLSGRPDARTRFPQEMRVDWIRIYQKST